MAQSLLIPIFLIISLALAGQKTTIKGRVTNNKKQGMQGASISIKDSYDGATSDSAGYFTFTSTDTGNQLITISSTGYKLFEQTVRLSGKTIEIAAMLKESMNELQAVMITAGSFEAGDEKKVTVLKTMDIVTTASANADVAAAMKTLPGTQQIGESAELFVRGGAGYETRQFFDGTAIANPNFSQAPDLASRGRFSPFLFKGTVFSTGGYSALYGQALSSALILESIDLPERSEASASFSPIFVGGQYQYLDKKKKYSWGGSAGYSNIGPYFKIIKQKNDFFRAPVSWNGDANFRIKTSKTGMVKFYTRYDGNKMGVRSPDIDSMGLYDAFNLANYLWYTNVSYKERLANRWKMNLGMSLNLNDDNNSQQVQRLDYSPVNQGLPPYIANKNFRLLNDNLLAQAKLVLEHKLSGLSVLRFGGEYWYSKDRFAFNQFNRVLEDHFKAAFVESDIYISNSIATRLGARLEHSNLLKRANLAPRASVAYKFNKTAQVSIDYGLFYQKPINQYLMETDNLRYMKATHAIITYQYMDALRTFRAQAFHKKYQQLVSTFPQNSSNGNGFAQGLEFFWRDKKTLNQFDYWVTYSFLDTRRQYLNFPYSMTPNFAAKHTANLVIKRFFTDLNMQVNANYQFASGRPYYRIGIDNNNQKTEITDAGTTAAYHNLSLSLNYLTTIAKSFAVIVFSVNNLTGSKQVFGYNYSFNGLNKTEINPAAPRFLFLGLFLSWGTDRRQDAINNNL